MLTKLRERLTEIEVEGRSLKEEFELLANAEQLDEAQEARFAELAGDESPIDKLLEEHKAVGARIAKYERLNALPEARVTEPGAPQYMKRVDPDVDVRTASRSEARSAALKVLETEHRSGQIEVKDEAAAQIEKFLGSYKRTDDGEVIFDGDVVARRLLITETPAYRSAFQKALKSPQGAALWDDEEREAMQRAAEQSLTNASGGFAVPVLIDPTLVLTSGGHSAPVARICRIEPITNNQWKGVTSAGLSFENLAENTAATAKQITLVQPTITAHKIAAFVPFSLEIEGDWPNFAADMAGVINVAYDDYIAEKTITGTGTIEMWGIFTAIDQTSASEVTPTTDGALGPEDAAKLWENLPERARSRSSWLADVTVENKFRNAGTNNSYFTVDLTAGGIVQLNGRPFYTSEYAPAFSGTTGASNLAILGDFSRYLLVPRVGMSLELIPHVTDSNGVPKGQRGYFAWARLGGDSIDDASFRLLQNQ